MASSSAVDQPRNDPRPISTSSDSPFGIAGLSVKVRRGTRASQDSRIEVGRKTMGSVFEIRRFWSARVDALARHLDGMDQLTLTKRSTRRRRMESTVQKPAVADKTTARAGQVPLNWNKWIRQIHRWLSIAFTVGVIVNIVAVALKKYSGG